VLSVLLFSSYIPSPSFFFSSFLFLPSCMVVFRLDCVCLDVRYSPLSCWSSVFFFFLAIFSVFRFRFHTSILSAPGNHIDVVAIGTNLYDSRACRVSEVFDFFPHKIFVLQMLFVSAFCCSTVFFFGAFLCFLYPLPHNFFSYQPQEFELVDFLYRFMSLLCIHSISGSDFVPHNAFVLLYSLYSRSS
jgi:hypothetical protein